MEAIRTEKTLIQHPGYLWMAWRGDYDLGTTAGYGDTQDEAIEDLKQWEGFIEYAEADGPEG